MNVRLPDHRHEQLKKWAVRVAIVAFMAATAWNVASRISVQNSNTASIEQVVDTIEEACQNRHALTVQYMVRGRNQRVMAHVQLLTVQAFLAALAESPPPPDATQKELEVRATFISRYRAAVPKLQHILDTTKILPLENCVRQARELRASLPPG